MAGDDVGNVFTKIEMQEYRPNPFEEVFNAELEEIAKRHEQPVTEVDRKNLAGLALSGGGIRSATTSLGVLQALKSLGLLGVFDYLSTVSGGGFAGGWWSAWNSRNFSADTSKEEKFFPPPEKTQPERDAAHELQMAATEANSSNPKPEIRREKTLDPVHHLRLFSNYLTPMKGPLSADTWRANAVISRNIALTWLVLVPMIFAAVLLAQSYFTMQPNSEVEFLYPYSHFADDNARTQGINFELKVANRLDSMVHGATGASSLAPIRELRELGTKKHSPKNVTSDEQFAIIAHDIDSLRIIDSTSELDLGDFKSFPMLQGELNRIEQGIFQWRRDDSLVIANHSVATLALPAAPRPDSTIKNNHTSPVIAASVPSAKSTALPSANPSLMMTSAKPPKMLPSAKHRFPKSSTKTRTALPSSKPLAAMPSPKPAAPVPQTVIMPAVSLVPLNVFLLEKAKDSIDKHYQRVLDPDVDSVKVRLTALEQALVAHREAMRDSWLFNDTHLGYLANRAVWASYLPIMMLGWMVMIICLWMINTSHKMFGGNVLQGSYAFIGGLISFDALNWLVPHIVGAEPDAGGISSSLLQLIWAAVALTLLSLLLWDNAHWFWKQNRKSMNDETMQEMSKLLDVRRARIVTYHQRLLLGAVLLSVLLCFGGFGHEAINYLLFYHSKHTWDISQWIARLGGIAVIFSALAGSGLAARKATTSSDRGNPKQGGKIKGMLIALAPPLILLLILCSVAWAGHWIVQDIVFRTGRATNQHYVILIFSMWLLGFLTLYYSVYDLHFRVRPKNATAGASSKKSPKMRAKQFSRLLLVAILLIQVAMMITAIAYPSQSYRFPFFWAALPIAVWGIIAWKYSREQKNPQPVPAKTSSATASVTQDRPTTTGSRILDILRASGTSMLILGFSALMLILISSFVEIAVLPIDHLFLVALGATLLILAVDLIWGVRRPEDGLRGNHEARILLGINATLYTFFLIIPPLYQSPHWGVTHVLEILVALAIGLVIFVGWRVDPNALSIHSFYRDRLIRAYLGASNRFRNRSSVSEVNPEDDIPLVKLTNCEQGAPYHLINTTLNLLGTKSLETAQRHASNFIMSKRFCGSVTTGYRPTEEYVSGSMTLGTAIAISGAAASPNMGSNQVSGATTMLMSLLNVRLGYWAANPGRALWREAQPKLWPYYLLKESLSQTTGFGAFCYLTDGGHFDNTGLYPLIERACRFIVVCDNGADPEAHFKDLGNALRRCRIDFGAEFKLDGLKQMTSLGGPSTRNDSGKAHWLRGTVTYSEEHLRTIWGEHWDEGLSAEERANYRVGAILVLKPTLLGDEPVDVLQYGLEYADFPQQSTANQWFSEDQFESYRRLGFWSAQTAFAKSDYGTATREQQLQAIAELPSTKQMPLASPQPLNELAYGPPSDERTPAITFSQPAI